MEELFCFVAVEFPDDPNVVGLTYWYLCDFKGAKVGGRVTAPLGKHNNLQERKKSIENEAFYPIYTPLKRNNAPF